MKRCITLVLCTLLLSVSAFAQHHGHRQDQRYWNHQGGNPSVSIDGNGWSLNFGIPLPPPVYSPYYQPPQTFYAPPVYVAPQQQRLVQFCNITHLGILPNGLPLQQKNCWLEWR